MHLTVYTSRAKHVFTATELNDLQAFAESANCSTGITGFLAFDGYRFIQALEGDTSAVQAVMGRITKDTRHDQIAYVENIETEGRQFDRWSTEYRDINDLSDGAEFLDRVVSRVVGLKNDATKAAFIGFAALSIRRRLET